MTIVEATSGNTGISFSALGAYYKHPVLIFMPDWVSLERVKLMQSYGASVKLVSKEEGGFLECIRRAREFAHEYNAFCPEQFSNFDNVEFHYKNTAHEILNQMPEEIDAFVSGIGTGGTLMGVGKKLKEVNRNTKIIALEPKSSPLLTFGTNGDHKIEGIGDDFIPELVDQNLIDDIYLVDDMDAINMSRLLACKLGLGVGISSGANLLASILCNQKINGSVVTVFPDDNKKYLSTDLVDSIDFNPNFISNQIKLIDYEIIA